MRWRLLLSAAVLAVSAVVLIRGMAGRSEQVRLRSSASLPAPTGRARPASAAGAPLVGGARPQVPLERMLGQQLMVRMDGYEPDRGLLGRIRRGQVGGVILFSENIESPEQVRAVVRRLQRAAADGGNPPLLIATDQEGGEVKRVPWAPPDSAPPVLAGEGLSATRAEGRRTGRALRSLGIDVDLAPVVDVPHRQDVFIWRQGRAFSTHPAVVRNYASAFAQGLEAAHVAPTAKHFPGLGGAVVDTDYALQKVQLRPGDLVPYRRLIAERVPLIMVSNAIYRNVDPSGPASVSRAVITGLLRDRLHYTGAVITDDLERPTSHSTGEAVVRAAGAGADIILVSSSETGGAAAFRALRRAAAKGRLPQAEVAQAYGRIVALKRVYARR